MRKNKLKVLTIANSFTDSLSTFWQKVVESAGCSLHFEKANHGGCELHRHWSYIQNEERDNVYRMYQNYQYKMSEVLAKEPWDIVTIQQASSCSWRYETFQPFADNIYEYIRKHSPQAEVIVQQTWTYRNDDPRLYDKWKYHEELIERAAELGVTLPSKAIKIDQDGMYDELTKAYYTLAQKHKLRIIPTGYAVQLSRENESEPFVNYDQALMQTLRWPDMPPQAGDVVGRIFWTKDQQNGEMKLVRDTTHLNARGEYLQACVWFGFLYERPVSEVTYVPDMISNSDAKFLREMAQISINEFKQVGEFSINS